MPANDPEGIDEVPYKKISVSKGPRCLFRENPLPAQLIERVEGIGASDGGMLFPVDDLKVLHKVFDVEQTPPAVLHVYFAGRNELVHLPLSERKRAGQVPGRAAVGELIAKRFDLPAERRISGDPSELDERLALEGGGLSVRRIIPHQLQKGTRQDAVASIGPKARIDLENPLFLCLDQVDDLLRQLFKIDPISDRLPAVGLSLTAVNE
jgi:hypothetical protein